jgi:hypothetical protein
MPVLSFSDPAQCTSAFEADEILRSIESDFQKIAVIVERAIDLLPEADREALTRAKYAADRGASIARKQLNRL